MPETPPAAVVPERPFWRDPVLLGVTVLFFWNLLDAWAGGFTWPEARVAILSAGIATARLAAPYVRSYIPFLDRDNPDVGRRD